MRCTIDKLLYIHLLLLDLPLVEPICLSGEVRLTGGETQNEGTVELCVGNRWEGSICDEGWDNADAAVICRQLGLTGEGEFSETRVNI